MGQCAYKCGVDISQPGIIRKIKDDDTLVVKLRSRSSFIVKFVLAHNTSISKQNPTVIVLRLIKDMMIY